MDKETEYEKDLGEIKPCSIHSSNSKLSGYATCCSNHTNELAILPNNPTVIQNFMKVFDPRLFAESVALLSLLNKILSKGSMPLVEAITNAFLRCSKVSFVYFVAWYVWKYIIAEPISNANKGVNNVWEQVKIASAAPKKKRIAIIGTGISGIQAIKACLAESGVEPVCFEADNDIGGFWRYKESTSVPSIYKSTHIDTDRDLAGYMDIPWNPNTQLTIRNDKMIKYLRDNIEILGLNKYIRFNHRVELVSPHEKNEINGWNWKISFLNDKNERTEEVFDGVMVATGRHGGGAYLPPFPGLETTKVTWMHSSQFKDPDFHNLRGKTVVVVGVGNSGIDIVTEVSPIAGKCFLVSRSGVWVTKLPHGDWAFSEGVGDRLTMSLFLSLPWMVQTELFERFGLFFQSDQQRDQEILNKHGLKPKHRFWQQHTIMTGLNGRATLHDELEAGRIIVKKGIDRMTENGVIFVDDDGNETKVDVVVFATGYKQQASFVDQKVVDLRFHRKGNDVMLYKYIFPTSGYDNIGFINLAQTITFMSSDLQTRAFMEVFMKRLKLPSKEIMEKEIQDVRRTLNAQYIDRSQLRVQGGANYLYYEDLAEFLGCNPTIWRILTQRPSAIWHSFFVTWCSLQYRLVGPGRLEIAERWIEERFQTRYYSATYPNGKKKKAPNDRDGLIGTLRRIQGVAVLYILRLVCIMQGHNMGGRIQDFLEANLKYAKEDMESRGIYHAIDEKDGAEPSDFSKYNGKISVWGKQ